MSPLRCAIAAIAAVLLVAGVIQVVTAVPSSAAVTYSETPGASSNPGGVIDTFTYYSDAGDPAGPVMQPFVTEQIACRVQGFQVPDGNTWWYQIASSPWNNAFYASADAFYNNGATSGSLKGTPFDDPAVPVCGSGSGTSETTGGAAHTWTNYNNAGGTQGRPSPSHQPCRSPAGSPGSLLRRQHLVVPDRLDAVEQRLLRLGRRVLQQRRDVRKFVAPPFVDPSVSTSCPSPGSGGSGFNPSPTGLNENAGGVSHTWTDYLNAGGAQGPSIAANATVQVACKVTGFAVPDGNTWWYELASSPWNDSYFVSADAFYNDGATSGSLIGTPYVDPAVQTCSPSDGGGGGSTSRPGTETSGAPPYGADATWADYTDAGGQQGPSVPAGQAVSVTCRITGFAVADHNSWWYLLASAPWDGVYYVSADAFYNNGATSGSLSGTPFFDPAVPICAGNQEAPARATSYGSSSAAVNSTGCVSMDPINCASGDFWQTFTDVSVPGRGPRLKLTRTYNDQTASTPGIFGNGWSSSYDQHLTVNDDASVTVTLDDGSELLAMSDGAGGYTIPAYANSTLAANPDGTFLFTHQATQFLTFSHIGQLLSIKDLNGYQTTLAYNASQKLSSVTDSAGRVMTVTIGANGFVSAVADPLGRTTHYSYNSAGDLTSVTDPLARTWTFGYDANNLMLTMTDPRGGVVTNVYNAFAQVTSQTDAAGLTTTYVYTGDNFSSLGGTTQITDPHGNVEVEQYANGFFTRLLKAYGTPQQAVWSYTYDPATFGLTQVIDPNGNVTTHTYNTAGQVLTSVDALGKQTSYTYNSFGEVLTTTKPLGDVTTNSYDANGNLLSVTDALGHTTSYAHADASHPGDRTSATDPDGRVTRFTYDADGDVATTTVSPASGTTDTTAFTFDADGEQLCQASANATATAVACPTPGGARVAGTTTTAYDTDGEVTNSTDANGQVTSYLYDADGNRTRVTDPAGNVTNTAYDLDSRISTRTTGVNGASPSTTSYAYDVAAGSANCPTVAGATYCRITTNPNGGLTVDFYDATDAQVAETLPSGQQTQYGHDLAGNRTTTVDNAGRATAEGYDADNQLTSITYSDGVTPGVSYTYDADGRRTTMGDGTGTTSYVYDADGRPTSVTNGAGAVTGYAYDNQGDITNLTYPGGNSVTRGYDGADRLVSVGDWLGHTTTFSYDADGNLTGTAYPDGDTVHSTYDAVDAMAATSVSSAGGSLASITYGRAADETITQQTEAGALGRSTTFAYDAKDEVTGASGITYGYDAAGNLTTDAGASQIFNSADELTNDASGSTNISYVYDAVGDRVSSTSSTGFGDNYSYDQAGRLTSVSRLAPPAPTVTSISPASGPIAGGTTVTITGSGFTGTLSVVFSSVAAARFTVVSDTQIVAVSPAQALGGHGIRVTTEGGTSPSVTADVFTAVSAPPVPAVTAVSPASGSTSGGTSVTVTGTGFSGATRVVFGSVAATSFSVVSDSQITAVSPAEAAGGHGIRVVTAGGTSPSVTADVFTFQSAAPTVTAINPSSGPTAGGTTVTVTGTGLTGATKVLFGSVAATKFTVVSGTQITAVAPAQAAGARNISVTTPVGTSSSVAADVFTDTAPVPVVTGIAPTSGPPTGGTTVTVTGSGFTAATKVVFGSVNATSFSVVSDTQLKAVSPAQAAATHGIRVVTAGGTSASVTADVFTYRTGAPAAIAAATLRPAAGASATMVASYKYNGDGLRMSETTAAGTNAFTWDSTPTVPEVLTDGSFSYIYGPGGLPIEQIDNSATPSYFFHDNVGTTRALLTSTGTVGATLTYSTYGTTIAGTGTLKTALTYAQGYADTNTGLLYLVNRYYDPATGQFITLDPALSVTGQPYAYANGDPQDHVDPSGLFCLIGKNPNGSCRGATEAEQGTATFVTKVASKVTDIGYTVYSGAKDGANLASTCLQSWSSYACGIAIQETGVDVSEALVSALCVGTLVLVASCNAAVSVGGTYLLNHFGISEPGEGMPYGASSTGTGSGSVCQSSDVAERLQGGSVNLQGGSVYLQGG